MKPLFKNITNYNSKNYNKFLNFHGKKFNVQYTLYTIIFSILILYCSILNIIQKNFTLAAIFGIMLILFFLMRVVIPGRQLIKTKKTFSKNKELKFVFSFYKFYFRVGTKNILYTKVHKIYETKDFFYIYLDEENAMLLSKTGFKIGTAKDFAEFIKKKCLFKYKNEIPN